METDSTPRVTEDQAKAILQPVEQGIMECVVSAWDTWSSVCETHPIIRIASTGRGRASLVYDLIAHNVRKRFPQYKNVRLSDRHGFIEVCVDGKIALRFKKVDQKFRSSNYPTKQHLLYSSQKALFGEELLAGRLTVGYQLDPTATQLVNVAIIYPLGRNPVWVYSIVPADGTATDSIPMPAPKSPVQPAEVRSKLRAAEKKAGTA